VSRAVEFPGAARLMLSVGIVYLALSLPFTVASLCPSNRTFTESVLQVFHPVQEGSQQYRATFFRASYQLS
jgi:hypothetical protein